MNTPYTRIMRGILISIILISAGASLGAVLRWLISTGLNSLFPDIPPGTLIVNMLGGYLIGMAIILLGKYSLASTAWSLFVITGFLGSLTTFSAFSAEVAALIQHGRWIMAAVAISAHVVGSLLMTFLGMASAVWAGRFNWF